MPIADLWDLSRPLAPVRYAFRVHDWKGSPWHVRRFKLTEALNTPYRLTIELIIDAALVDLDEVLGDACEFDLDRDTSARTIHGLVLAAEDLGRSAGFMQIRLEIGPALALLDQRVDTRAWQEKTAPEILHDVLGAPLAEHGRALRTAALRLDVYPRRDYCVQYQESDLAFAARLMEEEGINYYFDHDGQAEVLVLTDDNADFAPLHGHAPVPLLDNHADTAARESVTHFAAGRRLVSTAVAQRNFDWREPQAPRAASRAGADRRGRVREVYEHDDIIYPGDGPRHAQLKQERLAVRGRTAGGRGNVTAFAAGSTFTLHGHARPDLDTAYILTRVEHEGDCPEESLLANVAAAPRYINTFEAIPRDVPFHPERLHTKPRVAGLLTATVTGPPGEEVYCDEHGRIKLLPHWDRLSPADDTSSWWVRVAQPVAGGGWGLFSLPRVGMEVILDFIAGDPDRPVVLACIHNGQNASPYSLPADKTKTTFKSSSSPGGCGSNELRFEDQAGAEEVYLHAQKDWNTVVDANMSLSVGGSESDSIGGSRSTNVGANDSLTVGANATRTIGANLTESVGANHTLNVGANQTVKIALNQDETIGVDQSLTVKGSRTKTITGAEATTVGGNRNHSVALSEIISVDGDQVISVGGSHSISIADNQATSVTKNHALTVTLASAETIGLAKALTIGGGYQETVTLVKNTMVGQAHLEAAGTLRTLSAGDAIVLSCGSAKLVLEKSGKVLLSGTSFEFTASGPVKINGTMIDLN